MRTIRSLALAAVLTLVAGAAEAQQPAPPDTAHKMPAPAYRREVPANLAAQAKISEDSARAIALGRVPGGAIQALELERERGALIYSWEIKVAGKPGITEVNVSAIDGRVVSVEHEGR